MKKNILFINGHLNCGGVERSLVDILKNLDYNKYNADLLLLEGFGDYLSEIPDDVNIKLIDLHNTYGSVKESLIRCLRKRDFICFYIRIVFIITKLFGINKISLAKKIFTNNKHYDLAIGFRTGICMNIAAFAVNAEKSAGWWHHGEYNLSDAETKDFLLSSKNLNKIISVSDGCKKMLSEKFPELSSKIFVIHNMIDTVSIRNKSVVPMNYEMNKDVLNILTVGRLSSEKHIENAVYASKFLVEHAFNNFKWHIVGDGDEKQRLTALVNQYDLSDFVVFHGKQNNPYVFMKNADLLVNTSYVESQCLVVLEAMSVGIPCVITRSLGPEEFAVNEQNCILVEPNLESLINGLNKMIKLSDSSDMVNSAIETANRYSPESIMHKFYDLLIL